jgi:hypothetical protein
MDPISASASVIAFIQLADRVIELCKYYIETAHDAPHDLRVILVEISSLRAVLDNIDFLLKNDPEFKLRAAQTIGATDGPVYQCRQSLQKLEELLPERHRTSTTSNKKPKKFANLLKLPRFKSSKKDVSPAVKADPSKICKPTEGDLSRATTLVKKDPSKVSRIMETLEWPLKAGKAQKLLSEIQQYKNTISLVLLTESRYAQFHGLLIFSSFILHQDTYKDSDVLFMIFQACNSKILTWCSNKVTEIKQTVKDMYGILTCKSASSSEISLRASYSSS